MRLENINILIVEDEKKIARKIKDALSTLKKGIDCIDINNVFIYEFQKIEENIQDYQKNIRELYQKIKVEVIQKKIDVIFVDLELLNDATDGIEILREFMKDSVEFKHILKYVISSNSHLRKDPNYNDVWKYAYFLEKQDNYREKFIEERLVDVLPVLVGMYREVKKLNDIDAKLNSIKNDTENIIQKVNIIEDMNKTMVELFPIIAPNPKLKQKILLTIKDDLENYLDLDFENLFNEESKKKNFLNTVSKEFKDLLDKDLKKGAWDTFKDSVKTIAKSQGIDDDNAALCAAKLSYRGYSKISNLLSGKLEV